MKITKSRIDALPIPESGQQLHWDDELKGFGVRVTASGKKVFILQYRIQGNTRRVTLGPYGPITCDEARKRAITELAEVYKGNDPADKKKEAAVQRVTLREVAQNYLDTKTTKNGPLRAATRKSIDYHITKTFSDWADKPVARIDRDGCKKRYLELSKTAPVLANQAFRVLRALLNWVREEYSTKDGSYLLFAENPVTRMLKTSPWNPEPPRNNRSIPLDKLGEAWSLLLNQRLLTTKNTRSNVDLVIFMLLTGTRIGEASRLTWDRVSLDGPLGWFKLIETKNHHDITIPMSPVLRELMALKQVESEPDNPYVFPAHFGGEGHIKDARSVMEKISTVAGSNLSHHDLRRTFVAVAHACGIASWKVEVLTNHIPQTVTIKNYTPTADLKDMHEEVNKIAAYILAKAAALEIQATAGTPAEAE
ncbi:integrase family protein [Uliginosibacterium sp. 31-16]|uniref:tyrosine-type recombinase/integrase n=1 Tax=Uliginosibacterium sp. 31-16 TaxID=3068315 RepID=UPI00273E55BD|nr:integrase family protein [Uliginosibacterium sp. 31-16]MDP5239104.1 integrase family protein [Uliginosibacterium sp. 31-16]